MASTTETTLESTLQPKTKLSGKVVKTKLAGVIVDVGQELPGVIHISQIQKDPVNRVEDVVQAGQTVDVWVRRVKKDRIELTMIEPVGMDWGELKPEMVVKGKVVRLETYGAFVEIGAERPGLIHISELAHGYVKTPGEVVKEGDEVDVMVLEVNRRKKQIRLSMKALQAVEEKEEAPAREERRGRGKGKGKGASRHEEMIEEDNTPKEPELTAMEIAWREALARAEEKQASKGKRTKGSASDEQESILNRTLKQRVPTH
jgi:ribosomal protein S1